MTDPTLRLDDFLPFRLSYASNLVSELIANAYDAQFGLTIPQWRVMTIVGEGQGVTQQDIGLRTRMDKVTVSRAAIALAKRGLIERTVHGSDKRARRLTLSQAGRALYAEVVPRAIDLQRRVFDAFDDTELALLEQMLRRIDGSAMSQLSSQRAVQGDEALGAVT